MEMLISCFCDLANFGCVNGLYVVLDFLAVVAVDLLMTSLLRCFVTNWFQMLFEINSIFFGNTAFWGDILMLFVFMDWDWDASPPP